jgi:mono/diheme cytochrome c family protein
MNIKLQYALPLVILFALAATSPLFAIDPATRWKKDCASCHGDDGRGDTKKGRKYLINDLTDPSFQAKFTDEEAASSIKVGLKDAKGKVIMKAIRGVTDDEVKALVAYVRSLKK